MKGENKRLWDGEEGKAMNLPLKTRDWPMEWHLKWQERAAIREFDGGMLRKYAEIAAEAEIRKQAMEESHVDR